MRRKNAENVFDTVYNCGYAKKTQLGGIRRKIQGEWLELLPNICVACMECWERKQWKKVGFDINTNQIHNTN